VFIQIEEWKSKIIAYARRLEIIRETKSKQLREWKLSDDGHDFGISETAR